MENDFKYCVDLVIQFIKILGSNDLERGWKNLKTFNFWELYQESDSVLTKYNLVDISSRCLIDKEKKKLFGTGLCKLEDYDPDNSKIMNAIYYLLYNSDTFHLSFLDIGNNYINNLKHRNLYRGETINTYNTLFGKKSWRNLGLIPNEISDKVITFRHEFLSIGNFLLLPNIKSNGSTINKLKGTAEEIHDYFPLFLEELISDKSDNIFSDLIKMNSYYFNQIGKTREDFLKNNFFDDNSYNEGLAEFICDKNYCYWNNKDNDDYKEFVDKYLDFSQKMITSRAENMVNKLKSIVEGEKQ